MSVAYKDQTKLKELNLECIKQKHYNSVGRYSTVQYSIIKSGSVVLHLCEISVNFLSMFP